MSYINARHLNEICNHFTKFVFLTKKTHKRSKRTDLMHSVKEFNSFMQNFVSNSYGETYQNRHMMVGKNATKMQHKILKHIYPSIWLVMIRGDIST